MSCVLTLALNDEAHERFEALRQRWFPPALNRIPAHVTLFHTLPEDDATFEALQAVAGGQTRFSLQVQEPRSMGRGVMYPLTAMEAGLLHGKLREAFQAVLTKQDAQGFRPHVVVQNKSNAAGVTEALRVLRRDDAPQTVEAVGLDLWRYLDGPWLHLRRFPFS